MTIVSFICNAINKLMASDLYQLVLKKIKLYNLNEIKKNNKIKF